MLIWGIGPLRAVFGRFGGLGVERSTRVFRILSEPRVMELGVLGSRSADEARELGAGR